MTTKVNKKGKETIPQELKNAIGAEKVKDGNDVLVTYASDVSPIPFRKPSVVVLPENREDVKATLMIANKHNISVTVIAGGVSVAGYSIPSKGGIVLDLRRMDKIIEINTDSGYAVIEPGVNFDTFTSALREKGFRCHIPTAPGSSTPLGNYLGRPSGSLSNRHLDSIIDLEVILPDGTVFNTGSSQFPNAGSSLRYGPHPDLAGLYTCGYGTLGIITKAAVRIYPINEANRVHTAAFDTFAASVDYVKELINNNIPEHCIIWNWQLYETFAVDTSKPGVAIPPELRADPKQAPKDVPYNLVTSLMSGYEEVMVLYEKICEKVAKKYGGRTYTKGEAEERFPVTMSGFNELYGKYHQVEPTFFGLGRYMAWIMFAEPKDVKKMEKWAVAELAKFNVTPVCYYAQPFDFGRSIFFRIFCFPDPNNQELVEKVGSKYREMWEVAMEKYKAIPMRLKPQFPLLDRTGGYSDVLRRIKKALDPNNILNRDAGLF
jgi:FAD/FMN-containing dehydrogenase